MLGELAAREDPAVDLGMEGLDAAVEDFRETGNLADADGLDTFFFQQLLRTSGGDDLPAEGDQAADEIHQAGLITDTD